MRRLSNRTFTTWVGFLALACGVGLFVLDVPALLGAIVIAIGGFIICWRDMGNIRMLKFDAYAEYFVKFAERIGDEWYAVIIDAKNSCRPELVRVKNLHYTGPGLYYASGVEDRNLQLMPRLPHSYFFQAHDDPIISYIERVPLGTILYLNAVRKPQQQDRVWVIVKQDIPLPDILLPALLLVTGNRDDPEFHWQSLEQESSLHHECAA